MDNNNHIINKNTRGAEWNIWDLHIHTPNTGKNDQFKGYDTLDEKWEKFFSILEENKDVKVLGITDYFSIENYLFMKEKQKSGRLQNVYLIPNVELRILPVTDKNTPINIHVLFDPKLDKDTIERDFFNELSFKYFGSYYKCNRKDLIDLGKKFIGNDISDERAYKEGLNQFHITYENLETVLNRASPLKGTFIVGLSNSKNDGNSGIQHSSLAATREEIYRLSDFIFSANTNDIEFFLGKSKFKQSEIIKKYGSIKPCIRGCDAHSFDNMFKYNDSRYTWIKALPTFEGLKQIIYEPEDRVRICEEKPEEKSDYQIIDSIHFNNIEMGNQEIKFNQNLNTIIGGRSSGKSILLGCLASLIDSSITPKNDKKYNDNIKKLITNAEVKWRDNTNEQRKIIYYSQSAISQKVREDEYGATGISELIEGIIKKEKEKNNLINQYESFLANNNNEINTKINQFCQIKNQIKEKETQITNIGNKKGIEIEIIKLQKEIDDIKKSLDDYLSEEDDQKYKEYKKEIEQGNIELDLLSSDCNQFKLLKTFPIFSSFSSILSKFSEKSYDIIHDYLKELEEEVTKHWIEFINSEIDKLNNTIETIRNNINEIKRNNIYLKGEKLQEDNTIIKSKSSKLQEENNKLNSIVKLEREIHNLKQEKSKLENEIWDGFWKYRNEAHLLSSKLTTQIKEVKIFANPIFTFKIFFNRAYNLLNKRNTEIKQFENYEEKEPTILEENMKQIFKGIVSDKYPLVKTTSFQQALTDLFATNYYKISYDVDYDGDILSKMSEGKKAFIVLRLLLDFDDSQCPIIIDQPEDDLDNRAIYDHLVSYLRMQKSKRQIILATHNPNIVVGADAELVIVANQNGDNSRNQGNLKFEYYENAIEDSFTDDNCRTILLSKGIREHICEVLEGGDQAFKIREKKYGYK